MFHFIKEVFLYYTGFSLTITFTAVFMIYIAIFDFKKFISSSDTKKEKFKFLLNSLLFILLTIILLFFSITKVYNRYDKKWEGQVVGKFSSRGTKSATYYIYLGSIKNYITLPKSEWDKLKVNDYIIKPPKTFFLKVIKKEKTTYK